MPSIISLKIIALFYHTTIEKSMFLSGQVKQDNRKNRIYRKYIWVKRRKERFSVLY
jgi:hypothetical protein